MTKRICPLLLACGLLSLCAMADAGESPAIAAVLRHSLSNELASLLLPLPLAARTGDGGADLPVTLVDGRYCGRTNKKGAAEFLALMYPGPQPKQRPAPILRDEDCALPPSTIAGRIITGAQTPAWIALVELEVRWKPWALEIVPTRIHSMGKAHHPPPRVHLTKEPIRVYTTSGLNVEAGPGRAVPLQVAVRWGADRAVMVEGHVAETPPARFGSTPTPLFSEETMPAGADAIVAIPHAIANKILNEYLAGQTYEITLAELAPTLLITHPAVKGGANTYITTSRLGVKEYPDAFNVELEWKGTDLQLARVTVTPRRSPCASGDLVCLGTKAGLDALAASFTRLLSTRYKDIPLRAIGIQNVFPVKVDGKEAQVRIDVLRSESRERDLVLYADVTVLLP